MEFVPAPDMTVLSYLGIMAVLFGVALLLAGFGIVNVGSITVANEKKTRIAGVVFVILGATLILPELVGGGGRGSQPLDTGDDGLRPISAATAQPAAMSDGPVFFDAFDEGLAPEWQVITGGFVLNNGVPYLSGGENAVVVVGNPDWDNFRVEVDLTAPPIPKRILGNGIGLVFAYNDTVALGDYSYVGLSNYLRSDDLVVDLHIVGEKGNADFDPEPVAVAGLPDAETPYTLRLEIRSEHLTVSVNGDVLFDVADVGQSLNGSVGFYTYEQDQAIKFDNFRVTALE